MTKEEAIVCLKGIKDYGRDTFTEQSDWQNSLDMAIKALEQQPSDDCVSRAEVVEFLKIHAESFETFIIKQAFITASVLVGNPDNVPPVTPTHCIAEVRFSKEDLRQICNERIEIACEHGTCKDCKHNKKSHNAITLCYTTCDLGHRFELREPSTFYCADFEKAR